MHLIISNLILFKLDISKYLVFVDIFHFDLFLNIMKQQSKWIVTFHTLGYKWDKTGSRNASTAVTREVITQSFRNPQETCSHRKLTKSIIYLRKPNSLLLRIQNNFASLSAILKSTFINIKKDGKNISFVNYCEKSSRCVLFKRVYFWDRGEFVNFAIC